MMDLSEGCVPDKVGAIMRKLIQTYIPEGMKY